MQAKVSRDIVFHINKSREELFNVLEKALEELREYDAIMIENQNANTAMAKDYMSLVEKCKALEEEIKTLKIALEKTLQDNKLKTSDIYGRRTEKLPDIVNSHVATEIIDEDTVEAPKVIPINRIAFKHERNALHRNRGKKSRGKREKDLAKLPSVTTYKLDINELNSQYGENNWRIAHWHVYRNVESTKAIVYEKVTYVPVVSVGLEHILYSVPRDDVIIKNSIVSASLAAHIFYHKFFLAMPIYRQAKYFENHGLKLSRQTMNNWVNRLATEVFSLVYDKLVKLLLQIEYHQCDETYFQVNKDGREAGSKSFMWIHVSSELVREHPIIVYCFELTRGTDHLRKFYEDFEGFISSDAYISYHLLGKEKADVIIICGCMMHLRRPFVKSLALRDIKRLDNEVIESLPETKVLNLIGEIYEEDKSLKTLSAENRKEMREKRVRPLLNKLYEYIDSIDLADPLVSDKLKDAIQYANNQKKYIYNFLNDGNIPIDNGAAERAIRSFAIGRNNWIACDSIEGAETAAIMYTIVETAKANNVNVYFYLRYLLEEVPKYLNGKSFDFLDDMLPWSDKYHSYEKTQSMSIPKLELKENEYEIKPKTPRKHYSRGSPMRLQDQDSATA